MVVWGFKKMTGGKAVRLSHGCRRTGTVTVLQRPAEFMPGLKSCRPGVTTLKFNFKSIFLCQCHALLHH